MLEIFQKMHALAIKTSYHHHCSYNSMATAASLAAKWVPADAQNNHTTSPPSLPVVAFYEKENSGNSVVASSFHLYRVRVQEFHRVSQAHRRTSRIFRGMDAQAGTRACMIGDAHHGRCHDLECRHGCLEELICREMEIPTRLSRA